MKNFIITIFVMVGLAMGLQAFAGDFSIDFDGIDDYVDVGDVRLETNFTISIWIKSLEAYKTIINRIDEGGSYSQYWYLAGGFIGNDTEFALGDGTSYSQVFSSQNGVWDNQWHNIIWTKNGDNQKTYIDGIEDFIDSGIDFGIGDVNPPTNTYIGQDIESGDPSWFFDGNIDEIRVYNRAVNDIEAGEIYNGIYNNTGLTHYYNFDEGGGDILYDLAGVENGTIFGGAIYGEGCGAVIPEYEDMAGFGMEITSSSIAGILGYSNNLFGSIWPLLALIMGFPIAFWLINKVIDLVKVRIRNE